MFEKPIDTSISVYRMKNYFAIIADLGVDFKAFTLSFLDSEKYLVDLKNLV